MKKLKIYAMIPARYGSTRLKLKNLALIAGKPMIYYALKAAKESGVFDKIFVNSENKIFKKIANRYNVDFYQRPMELGSSVTKSDFVIADFMEKHPEANIVAWVNPIAPFQTGKEIANIVDYFIVNSLDSLITTEEKQVHCNFQKKPINYKIESKFAQTQDLDPVQAFVYTIMIWKSKSFLNKTKNKDFSLFCGKFDIFSVKKQSALIVKNKEDLKIADLLMRSLEKFGRNYKIAYDDIV